MNVLTWIGISWQLLNFSFVSLSKAYPRRATRQKLDDFGEPARTVLLKIFLFRKVYPNTAIYLILQINFIVLALRFAPCRQIYE